jgi:hypothetical protein
MEIKCIAITHDKQKVKKVSRHPRSILAGSHGLLSALSLRVFGQDVTVFGKQMLERQAAIQGRRQAAKEAQETIGSDMDSDDMIKHDESTNVE